MERVDMRWYRGILAIPDLAPNRYLANVQPLFGQPYLVRSALRNYLDCCSEPPDIIILDSGRFDQYPTHENIKRGCE